MNQTITYTTLILLLFYTIIFNCSCQTIPKENSKITQKNSRIFGHKPTFQNLIDDVIKPVGYVNDYDSLFSPDEIYQMDSLLYFFEIKDSIQIVVVTFDTSQIGPSEVDVATKAIRKGWKVGGDYDRGIVIGISKPYRKMKIENGLNIKKILADEETKRIVDNNFIPEFKKARYFSGTWSGLGKPPRRPFAFILAGSRTATQTAPPP